MNQAATKSLSAELREQTKDSHQALEAVVVRKIKEIRSYEQYGLLLQKFYGYHFPMEQLMDKYLNDEIIPSYKNRRRAGQILKDLTNLGITKTDIPQAAHLPVIDSVAKAMGAFYVLEGSTQGGSIVAGMLIKYAGLTPDTTSFFYAYGDDKSLWHSFKAKVDSWSADPAFRAEAVKAANETFAAFKEWMIKF